MKILDVSSVLKDEHLFNSVMTNLNKSYAILGVSSPFSNTEYNKFIHNEFLTRQLSSILTSDSASSYNSVVQTAQEKQFKQTFGVDFNVYKKFTNHSLSFKKGSLNPIAELSFDDLSNPDIISDTKQVMREIIQDINPSEIKHFNQFVMKERMLAKISSNKDNTNNQILKNNI